MSNNNSNTLKSSTIASMRSLWQDSNTSTNIQYNKYRSAKHVLKSIQTQHHHRITEELTSQGLITASIQKCASLSTTHCYDCKPTHIFLPYSQPSHSHYHISFVIFMPPTINIIINHPPSYINLTSTLRHSFLCIGCSR